MKPFANLAIIAAGVASGFVVMLWTGFHLDHRPAPPPIDSLFPPALLILLFAAAWLIRLFATSAGEWVRQPRYHSKSRAELRAEREAREAEQRERLARMKADPALAPYAARIEAGEHWSDAQIAYDLDPAAFVTCEHLSPIERAMRQAGMPMKLQFAPIIYAECLIDEPALRQRFGLVPPARYGMLPQYDDRGFEDPPAAAIRCDIHNAIIHVRVPELAAPDTPVFPA